MADPLLRLIDINKSYPGVRALSRVSLTVNRGEVLALIGENGAGKSTLMKILGGVVKPDQGTIEIDGVAHEALTVPESLSSGIAFVHQELNLFDNLDVGANVLIGTRAAVRRPPQARRPQGDEAHRGAVAEATGRRLRGRRSGFRPLPCAAPAFGDRQGAFAQRPRRHYG